MGGGLGGLTVLRPLSSTDPGPFCGNAEGGGTKKEKYGGRNKGPSPPPRRLWGEGLASAGGHEGARLFLCCVFSFPIFHICLRDLLGQAFARVDKSTQSLATCSVQSSE